MPKIVYLFHGFNVTDGGAASIDTLIPYISALGHNVIELDYGWTGRLGVRLCNKKLAMVLSRTIQPGASAIGHSNGCAIIHKAMEYGAPFSRVVYINPALNRNADPGDLVEEVHVFHTKYDGVIRFARWIPWSIWGDMGAVGYRGKRKNVVNHNMAVDPYPVRTHSGVFREPCRSYWGPKIAREV